MLKSLHYTCKTPIIASIKNCDALFVLMLYIQVNIFQSCPDISWVEPVLSRCSKTQQSATVKSLAKNVMNKMLLQKAIIKALKDIKMWFAPVFLLHI